MIMGDAKWFNKKMENGFNYSTFDKKEIFIEDVNPSIIKKDFVKPEEMNFWELSTLIKKFKKMVLILIDGK